MRSAALLCCLALCGLGPVALGATPASAAPAMNARAVAAVRAKDARLSPRLAAVAAAARSNGAAFPRAAALGLPGTGEGSLIHRAGGRVLVEIRATDVDAATVAQLQAAGAQIVNVSSPYRTITADVAASALSAVAAVPSVGYVSEVLAPRVGSRGSIRVPVTPNGVSSAADQCGSTTSEGDTLMNVAAARSAFTVDGTGETVGILSDSYNTAVGAATDAQTDVTTGDLPGVGNPCGETTPVVVQADFSGGGQADEGRGMAQLVHDLAPGAKIAFATAFNGELDFASQITKLRTVNHATVIADDVSYLDEPFFQNGPIANAANLATTSGVPYFSAAGNDNLVVGNHNVGSYMASTFRSTPCPAAVLSVEPLLGCHNFNPTGAVDSSDAVTVAPGGGFGVDLQWAQPWGGVTTDFDVFLVDTSGTVVAQSTINNQSAETPFEFADYTNQTGVNQTLRIVIGKYAGTANPRIKFVLSGATGILSVEHNVSTGGDVVGPTIFGHSGAPQVGSTAAIPYDDSTAPENFSSRGPVTLYFANTPSTAPLAAPKVVNKPDFAATDGVQTTFFAQQIAGVWRFYGTSAAAPQAAAIAALIQQDDPALTAAQVMTRMHDTATALTGIPATAVGGGYLDADAALTGLPSTPAAPVGVTAATGDAQATVSWTAPATNPSFPITGYTVTPFISGVAQTPATFDASATQQVIAPLVNGTKYTFTVAATNANGTGPGSVASAAITVGVPSAPAVVSSIAGNATATVTWSPPAVDNGSAVTGYVVTPIAAGVAKPAQTFATAATTRTIVSLTNGVVFTFRVAAVNANGAGAAGAAGGSILVGAPTPPTTPTATAGNAAATIAWHPPTTNNGAAVVHYFVTPYRNGVAQPVHTYPATPLTQSITGLANGIPYTFRIAAANARGTGVSVATTAIVIGAPLAPTAAHATVGAAVGQVSVHWTAPTSGNGAAITGYVVTPYVGAVAGTPKTFASAATTEVMTGLTSATSYTFTVAARNARGVGVASARSNAVAPT